MQRQFYIFYRKKTNLLTKYCIIRKLDEFIRVFDQQHCILLSFFSLKYKVVSETVCEDYFYRFDHAKIETIKPYRTYIIPIHVVRPFFSDI